MAKCDDTFQRADALLKRNWFLCREDFLDYIWKLPEDVYLRIIDNRHQYVSWIQDLLSFDPLPTGKLRIRDVSNAEWNKWQQDKADEFQMWIQNHRKTFVCPPRPRDELDERMAALVDRIERKRALLEELKTKGKKYVPPGQRGAVPEDPMVRDARHDLQELENEFARVSERVDACNKLWTEEQWIDVIQLDVRKRRVSTASNADVKKSSV